MLEQSLLCTAVYITLVKGVNIQFHIRQEKIHCYKCSVQSVAGYRTNYAGRSVFTGSGWGHPVPTCGRVGDLGGFNRVKYNQWE